MGESGNSDPPFVPNQDEINADSLRHIGRPPNDDKYKDVEVTPAFEKQLADFPFVSTRAQQEEMVAVLKTVQQHYDFKMFVDELAGNGAVTVSQLAQIPSNEEIYQFAQSVEEKKHRNGMDGFVPDYYLQRNHGHKRGGGGVDSESDRDEEWSDGDQEEESTLYSTEREKGNGDSDHDIGHHYDNQNEERYNKIETSSSFKPKKSNHTESTMSHSEEMVITEDLVAAGGIKGKRSGSSPHHRSSRGGAGNGTQSVEDEEEQKPIMELAAGNSKILEDHTTEDSVSGVGNGRREEEKTAAAGKCICVML